MRDTYRKRVETLLESLPYIRMFSGSTMVIKYGGAAMSSADLKDEFATDIALLRYVGIKPIIVHGDGSSLWVVTHAEDFGRGFLGLLGNYQALGHAFHITSDEVLTWDQIYLTIADALGVEAKLVHIASEFIANVLPDYEGGLLGDKTWSAVFDNSKIKSFVPGFQAVIPFREGIRRTLAWFAAEEQRRRIDEKVNQEMELILKAYQK